MGKRKETEQSHKEEKTKEKKLTNCCGSFCSISSCSSSEKCQMRCPLFSHGLRDSISHCVSRSVCLSVGRSVPRLLFWCFWCIASSFFITAPAQSNATEAVVFTALPTAPALHITAPAQPPRLKPVRVSGLVSSFKSPQPRLAMLMQLCIMKSPSATVRSFSNVT